MQQLRKKQIYLKENNNNKKYKHNINLALLENM